MADLYDKVTAASPVNRDKPHAWIQWKGTDVCADIRCDCGRLGHIDAGFAYSVRCACGKLWGLDPHVTMVPLNEKDVDGACDPVPAGDDEDFDSTTPGGDGGEGKKS